MAHRNMVLWYCENCENTGYFMLSPILGTRKRVPFALSCKVEMQKDLE